MTFWGLQTRHNPIELSYLALPRKECSYVVEQVNLIGSTYVYGLA